MRQDEFERLYERHARPLLSFLIYRTGDEDLAEDVLADTFERVFRSRQRFDRRKASEKTWIYSIALNRLRDHARRAATEDRATQSAAENAVEPVTPADALENRDLVVRAMRMLSQDQRDAVALRYGGDLTIPEIAKLTGAPRTTIEKRLSRALQQLRAELAAEASDPRER